MMKDFYLQAKGHKQDFVQVGKFGTIAVISQPSDSDSGVHNRTSFTFQAIEEIYLAMKENRQTPDSDTEMLVCVTNEQIERTFEEVEVKFSKAKLEAVKQMVLDNDVDIKEALEETLLEQIGDLIHEEWGE